LDNAFKLIGYAFGFIAGSIVNTWVGLYFLAWLGWLPF